jgi:hypothetical protein
MADGVWTLPPMAQGRPLAADSGVAAALPMMQTTHSRDQSGTVGLGKVAEVAASSGGFKLHTMALPLPLVPTLKISLRSRMGGSTLLRR